MYEELNGNPSPWSRSLAGGQPASPTADEITIADLWRLVVRRRATILCILLVMIAAGALLCVISTRRFQATARLQVQKEVASPLGLRGSDTNTSYSDALEDNLTLQTQASILESDTLALSVIEKQNLEANADFKPKFSPIGWVLSLVTPDGPPDPGNVPLENAPRRREAALRVFKARLKVKPVPGTRLIEVSFLNSDPAVASSVANGLSQGLVEYNFQIRHAATSKTAQWLSGQLADLRRESEDLQNKVAQAQRESGVLSLGGLDSQGHQQIYSNVLDKLQQATTAYVQAESGRILKQAIYEVAKTGDPEAISGLAGNPMFAGSSGMSSTLTLIQSLRMHQADTQSQIAALAAKFGPAYPKLAEMQNQLDATNDAIRQEVQRITERARNDFDVARQVEGDTHTVFLEQKQEADGLNDKAMTYTILRQEADGSRALYEGLFSQMKEAGILADFHSNNIGIVDPARVPAKPARPMVLIYMLASVAAGLLFGFCGALLRDGMDRKIQSVSEVETRLREPVLALLPYHKPAARRAVIAKTSGNGKKLLEGAVAVNVAPPQKISSRSAAKFPALGDTSSSYVEALRALRTNLMLSRSGAPPQVVLVTSSVTSEGKSMLSVNLAALLALQQKEVLLIDADLRRPMLHHRLGLNSGDGLSSFLAGQGDPNAPPAIIPSDKIPGLYILPAGPPPPYPAELLGSEKMRRGMETWREHFDFIIIDGPPVLPVTDSVVLNSMADFTLLLARYRVTERQSLQRSHQILESQGGPHKVGIVLNAVRDSDSYYPYSKSKYFRNQEQVL